MDKNQLIDNEKLDSAKARGCRLRDLKKLMKLKRYEFSRLVGVSTTTISLWEHATAGSGLTEEGAQKVVQAAKAEGYICSIPWLLYGIGEPPRFAGLISLEKKQIVKDKDLDKQLEIKYFLSSSSESVAIEMPDNSMYPVYEQGDWVGGQWIQVSDKFDTRKKYIVRIGDSLQVRMIRKTSDPNLYDLYSLSFLENPSHPLEIKNIKVDKVAKIIRVWS